MNFIIFCNVEVSILWLDHGGASMKSGANNPIIRLVLFAYLGMGLAVAATNYLHQFLFAWNYFEFF